MHNVGIEIKERHNFKYGAAEESKSLSVVKIAVATRTLKVKFVIYKVENYAVLLV
jgi:hypothetical protein